MREALVFTEFLKVPSFDAQELLEAAAERHGVRFDVLVAETSLWASPDVHHELIKSGSPAWFPFSRRARSLEKRGQVVNGIVLDDNTKANQAIKLAVGQGRGQLRGYATCHVWPGTCYSEEFHTVIANLVLLPRALAGLSDHHPDVVSALKYRAYELYGWFPTGEHPPEKPSRYPIKWRQPEPFNASVRDALARRRAARSGTALLTGFVSDRESAPAQPTCGARIEGLGSTGAMDKSERDFVVKRIRGWSHKPEQLSHLIISIVRSHEPLGIHREALVQRIKLRSRNPGGAIDSLRRSDGNAYGRALHQSSDGMIRLHPAVAREIKSLSWRNDGRQRSAEAP